MALDFTTIRNNSADLMAPGDRGHQLTATSAAMIALTTVAVALRFVSRYLSKKAFFWWDDWCALAAWVLLIPMFAILIDSVNHGIGRHEGTLSVDQIDRLGLDIYVGEIFYNTGLTATKYSVLFFYMRIFPWERAWFRFSIYLGFCLCTSWCVAITFMGSFQCSPPSRYWKIYEPGTCLNTLSINLGTSIPNVIIDTYLLLIPMPFIRRLRVNMKKKIGVAFVFFAGYATLALSITRVIVSADLRGEKLVDYSWNCVTFLLVVDLEPALSLISVCLPAQVYLVRYVLTEVFGMHWTTMTSSVVSGGKNLKQKSKRSSDRVKSMIQSARWRNLSNATSNTSYQAEISADLTLAASHTQQDIQGIQVQTSVEVRPSSWAPQFAALILG